MTDKVSLGPMPAVVDICCNALAQLRAEEMTILLVEQSTRAFDSANSVCILESGRPVWQGTAEDARNDPKLQEAYWGLAA